jgi:hypothetical protein
MKKLLVLAAAALMVCFSSCDPTVKTLTDYLTAPKKGWVMETAVSDPAYVMNDGSRIQNLMEGYFFDYEMDDIISFDAEGNETIDPGKLVAADGAAYQNVVTAKYTINEETKILTCQMPWIYEYNDDDLPIGYSPDQEICQIITLDDNMLKIRCTIDDVAATTKDVYSFTITYVPAK